MNRLTTYRMVPAIAALAALLIGLLFAAQGAQTADGVPALPLDDAYIHLQYGWQAAQGQFLQYNPGDAPTTGATSLLYMLLLAAGFALGIGRAAMPGVTLVFGGGLFVVSAALLADLARRTAALLEAGQRPHGERSSAPAAAGLLAGLLFAGSGWMAWAFFSGMETGLLIALVIATLWAFAADRPRLTTLFASLAVLARPEALILAVMLPLALWLVRDERETGTGRNRLLLWALIPLGAALIVPLINLIMTGTFSATGLQAKSWLTVVPFYPDRIVFVVIVTTLELLGKLFGGPALDGRWHAFPLAQALATIGLGVLWVRGGTRARRLALVMAGWVLLGTAATATLQTATWHHHRYQMPFYPALIVPLAVALVALIGEIGRRRGRGGLMAGRAVVSAAVVLWTLYTLGDFRAAYVLDTTTTATQQSVLADWLRANTPPDARIAVHDVGAMRYVGDRYTVDVVGLTTAGMASVSRSGPGAVYEAMEHFQPDYYAVYPTMTLPYYGVQDSPALFGEELFRVTIDPWSPYASAEGTQIVSRPDWSGVPLTAAPQQPGVLARLDGWTQTDRLDVADLENEAAHGYRWWNSGRPDGFVTVPRMMRYREEPLLELADAGRQLTGGESFTLATPQAGEWLMLVARLHQTADMTLRVRVNGVDAGLWRLPAVPGEWLESAFLIGADLVRGPETPIELAVEDAPPDARYSPFYYWAYQGEPEALPPAPATVSGAAFDDVARLRGFDLPTRIVVPGETLPVTLYWEAIDPPQADHRVFLHLIDPDNDTPDGILTQYDGQPRRGTYPFWVWRRREALDETIALSIPPDAPPGEYLLLLGIYDGVTGERLPIVGGDDFGASRLILGTITVR